MVKLGDSAPQIIDKAIDFMASSQAFREYLTHKSKQTYIPDDIPEDKVGLYLERLEHYRQLYRPECIREEETE